MPTDPSSALPANDPPPRGTGPLGDAAPLGETERARRFNMRLALSLFALYSLVYAAFVLTNAFYPNAMETRPWGGLNLALLAGFGLIVMAILLAFIYGLFSRTAAIDRSADNRTGHPRAGR
jgi:uncharacterized membrane protein (DUF485 family)